MYLYNGYRYFLAPASLVLIVGIIIYGLFSSPTPDVPGIWEALSVLCLVLPFLFTTFSKAQSDVGLFEKLALIMALYFLIFPGFIAALQGNPFYGLSRDVISIVFLFLPIILLRANLTQNQSQIFILFTLFIGLSFSTREVFSTADTGLLYLANSPEVLFTAVLTMGFGIQQLSKDVSTNSILVSLALLSVSLLCLFAMSINLQRAPIAYLVFAACFMVFAWLKHSSLPLVSLFAAASLLYVSGLLDFARFMEEILEKQRLAGVNMRLEEASEVIAYLADDPLALLFGKGWGASFPSPAVAGIWVNYTHNFFTALWLKTGLIGVLLAFIYMCFYVKMLWQIWQKHIILGCALAGPFFIGLILYANYKSLGFGLILSIIALRYHEQKK